jgi:hypothetical protein
MIVGERARFVDYGAQLGDASVTGIVEITGGRPGLRIASCRGAIAGALGSQCLRSDAEECRQEWPPFPSS